MKGSLERSLPPNLCSAPLLGARDGFGVRSFTGALRREWECERALPPPYPQRRSVPTVLPAAPTAVLGSGPLPASGSLVDIGVCIYAYIYI